MRNFTICDLTTLSKLKNKKFFTWFLGFVISCQEEGRGMSYRGFENHVAKPRLTFGTSVAVWNSSFLIQTTFQFPSIARLVRVFSFGVCQWSTISHTLNWKILLVFLAISFPAFVATLTEANRDKTTPEIFLCFSNSKFRSH